MKLTVNYNRFSEEQMNWLRLLKNHVLESFHLEVEDLDYTPFDAEGGRGKMYELFGDDMNDIINELNEVLAV
jgi:type I restriction enzyme R subunit